MTTSTTTQNDKIKNGIKKLLVILFWLGVWQVLYLTVKQEILLVSPAQVFFRLIELVKTNSFWVSTFRSLLRIMEGYLLAIAVGTLLAVLTTKFKIVNDLLYPILSIIKATPVASFIILALVWIGRDNVPMFISFLMVMPMVWSNVSTGIKSVDGQLVEMANAFDMNKSKTIRYIYVPSVMPSFLSACTTGLGFAWKSGIAAEVISTPEHSIGTHLFNAKIYIETCDLFAWTIVVVLLSVIIEKILVRLLNKVAGRQGKKV